MSEDFAAAEALLKEHAELETLMSDPAVLSDQNRARKVGRRYAALGQIVAAYRSWSGFHDDLEAARELADDPDLAAEIPELETAESAASEHLRQLLLPRDPDDASDVILEVKAGEGGDESALFAADLVRMYMRYSEQRGWSVQVLSETYSDLGGYKDVSIAVWIPSFLHAINSSFVNFHCNNGSPPEIVTPPFP